jgi:hypothetical protein
VRDAISTAGVLACGLAVALAGACQRAETWTQQVTRLRQQYLVRPNGYQPRHLADGSDALVVDVLVSNSGKEGLDRLTLLVQVVGRDGHDRAAARATVDTSSLLPGVTEQRTAIARGLRLEAGDSVFLELENEPPAAALDQYPEYREEIGTDGSGRAPGRPRRTSHGPGSL